MRLRRQLRFGLCVSIGAIGAAGTPLALASEMAFFDEVPVVLSASRLRQSLSETPGAVSIIDRELIRVSGARELSEVMRLIPGFQTTRDGSTQLVGYHGVTNSRSNRLQVLIDGRSLFTQAFEGGVDWSTLPVMIDEIERVEVFRGSNGASYGSDSFLGVVNIITLSPASTRAPRARVSLGNHGVRDLSVTFGAHGQAADLRVSAGQLSNRGDEPFGLPNQGDPEVGFANLANFSPRYSPRRTHTLNARLDWRLNARDEVHVSAGLLKGRLGEGDYGTLNQFSPPTNKIVDKQHFAATFRRVLNVDHEWSVSLGRTTDSAAVVVHYDIPANWQKTTLPALKGAIDHSRRSAITEFGFEHALRPVANTRVVWGVKARNEAVVAPIWLGRADAVSADVRRVFGNVEWQMTPTLLLNVGATVEHYSLTGRHHTPRVMLNWQVAPDHTLRAGVSEGRRLPSVWEKHADWRRDLGGYLMNYRFLSTGAVNPETLIAREVSYFGRFPAWKLTVDVRGFEEIVRQVIVPYSRPLPLIYRPEVFDPAQVVTDFTNAGQVKVRGLELQVDHRPLPGSRVMLSHTVLDINSGLGFGAGTDRLVNGSAPRHNSVLLVAHQLTPTWEASASWQRMASIAWLSARNVSPSYERLDLRVARQLRIGATPVTIALTAQAANGRYIDGDLTQEFRPRYFLTVQTGL